MQSNDIIRFEYTDKKDEVTERTVVVLSPSQPNVKAIDISNLTIEQLQQLTAAMEQRNTAVTTALNAIPQLHQMVDFPLEYRSFVPDRIRNIKQTS